MGEAGRRWRREDLEPIISGFVVDVVDAVTFDGGEVVKAGEMNHAASTQKKVKENHVVISVLLLRLPRPVASSKTS